MIQTSALPSQAAARNPSCPLCGGPNDCVPARTGSFDTPCWCQEAEFDPATLAALPLVEQRRSCLCRSCATRHATRES